MNAHDAIDHAVPIPAHVEFLFRDPPLVPPETPASWMNVVRELSHAVCPADLVEWIWLRELAVYLVEHDRLVTLRAEVIRHEIKEFIENKLHESDPSRLRKLLDRAMNGDKEAATSIEKKLRRLDISWADAYLHALQEKEDELNLVEERIHTAQTRRDRLFADITNRQNLFGRLARSKVKEIELRSRAEEAIVAGGGAPVLEAAGTTVDGNSPPRTTMAAEKDASPAASTAESIPASELSVPDTSTAATEPSPSRERHAARRDVEATDHPRSKRGRT